MIGCNADLDSPFLDIENAVCRFTLPEDGFAFRHFEDRFPRPACREIFMEAWDRREVRRCQSFRCRQTRPLSYHNPFYPASAFAECDSCHTAKNSPQCGKHLPSLDVFGTAEYRKKVNSPEIFCGSSALAAAARASIGFQSFLLAVLSWSRNLQVVSRSKALGWNKSLMRLGFVAPPWLVAG